MACRCRTCSIRRPCDKCRAMIERAARGVTAPRFLSGRECVEFEGKFQGWPVIIRYGGEGIVERFEFFYGGIGRPNGPGHGHVVCNDGETIHYWRKPLGEGRGRRVVIDNERSCERLVDYWY